MSTLSEQRNTLFSRQCAVANERNRSRREQETLTNQVAELTQRWRDSLLRCFASGDWSEADAWKAEIAAGESRLADYRTLDDLLVDQERLAAANLHQVERDMTSLQDERTRLKRAIEEAVATADLCGGTAWRTRIQFMRQQTTTIPHQLTAIDAQWQRYTELCRELGIANDLEDSAGRYFAPVGQKMRDVNL